MPGVMKVVRRRQLPGRGRGRRVAGHHRHARAAGRPRSGPEGTPMPDQKAHLRHHPGPAVAGHGDPGTARRMRTSRRPHPARPLTCGPTACTPPSAPPARWRLLQDGDHDGLDPHPGRVSRPRRPGRASPVWRPMRVRCIHMEGSGCYGHNGADDAGADAALLAQRAAGPPGAGAVDAGAGEHVGAVHPRHGGGGGGLAVRRRHDRRTGSYAMWSNTHNMRPGNGGRLMPSWAPGRPAAHPLPAHADPAARRRRRPQRHPALRPAGGPRGVAFRPRVCRCGCRPCAAWAPTPTSSPSRASWTSWPPRPEPTPWPSGCST